MGNIEHIEACPECGRKPKVRYEYEKLENGSVLLTCRLVCRGAFGIREHLQATAKMMVTGFVQNEDEHKLVLKEALKTWNDASIVQQMRNLKSPWHEI